MGRFTPEIVDEHGLLRNQAEEILIFRALAHSDTERRNGIRTHHARTAFHGIDGVYGGNTLESIEAFSLPYRAAIALPEDTEINDLRHVSNWRWAGRCAVRSLLDKQSQRQTGLVVVRPTPLASFLAHRYTTTMDGTNVAPSWVIVPPEDFATAPKMLVE